MTGRSKPSPREAFEKNIDDAEILVLFAEALTNSRARKMRKELREKIGKALKYSAEQRESLDCAESDDAFVVLKPGGRLNRHNFRQHEPLLRQALVAGCAATETYMADRSIVQVRKLVASGRTTKRMNELSMTYDQWLQVEGYQRKKRGITEKVLAPHIREIASTAPSRIGEVLSLVGFDSWASKVDAHRKCPKGGTVKDLDRITKRRNKIAHEGDRSGYGRAPITSTDVQTDLEILRSVVLAIEELL